MDKQKIASFFDAKACEWDQKEPPGATAIVKIIIDKIAPPPQAKILDIGCGTGVLYPFLQACQPEETLHIDISPGMLARFSQKHPAARLQCADFETISLPPDYFDIIIAYNVFPHFIDKQKVFANAYKFLKPGGAFYIVHSMTRGELQRIHGGNAQTKNDLLPTSPEMEQLYQAAGFKNIVVQESNPGFHARAHK